MIDYGQGRRGMPIGEGLPTVPYVPFRCPRCHAAKPRTYAVRQVYRYHKCRRCGHFYRSLELDPAEVDLPRRGGQKKT